MSLKNILVPRNASPNSDVSTLETPAVFCVKYTLSRASWHHSQNAWVESLHPKGCEAKQMHMICRQHAFQNRYTHLCAYLTSDVTDALLHRSGEHFIAIFGNPYQVIAVVKFGVRRSAVWHEYNLQKVLPLRANLLDIILMLISIRTKGHLPAKAGG